MAVILRRKFNAKTIDNMIAERRQRIYTAITAMLVYVGEDFVVNARSTDTYKDRTTNLRSSIGYVVYQEGKLVNSAFPGQSGEGNSEGRKLADEVAKEFPYGFVLVCVAGMEYAAAVESRGYDVITNSSLQALVDLKEGIKRIKQKINRGGAP